MLHVMHPTTQVKIFGSFVRWSQDVPPPSRAYPGRTILTIAGERILQHAKVGQPPGGYIDDILAGPAREVDNSTPAVPYQCD